MGKNRQQARIASILFLLGILLAVGGFWFLQPAIACLGLLAAVAGGVWLRRLSRISPMPRPGLDDRDRDG